MEELYALFLLWFHDLCSGEEYEALLNRTFLESQNQEILLELEECSSKLLDTHGCFSRYWNGAAPDFDKAVFGKALFHGLKEGPIGCALQSLTKAATACGRICLGTVTRKNPSGPCLMQVIRWLGVTKRKPECYMNGRFGSMSDIDFRKKSPCSFKLHGESFLLTA